MSDSSNDTTVRTETVHTTSDGRKFKDQERAEQHEALITARSEFEQAEERYTRLLAQTFKTADGREFSFSHWHYYRLTLWFGVPASVQELSIYPRDLRLPESHTLEGEFEVKVKGWNGKEEWARVQISELYWSKKAARLAATESRAKRLVEMERHERDWVVRAGYGEMFDQWQDEAREMYGDCPKKV